MKCTFCGTEFMPADRLDLTDSAILDGVPSIVRGMAKSLLEKHRSRVLVNRCSRPECFGLVTIAYRPEKP